MKVSKNLLIVWCIICFIPVLKAQNICVNETAVFKNDALFFALPNAFTPNNDGLNDALLFFNSALQQRRIIITDPAKKVTLFNSDDKTAAWDGLDTNEELVPEGIYMLTANYLFENNSVEIACRTIYLIRENCLDFNEDSLNFPSNFNEAALKFENNTVALPACISSTFTPNEGAIRLYPNPASKQLFFDELLRIEEVRIFSSTGKLLILQHNFSNQVIDISALQAGMYIVQFVNQQSTFSKTILVK